MKLSNLPVKAEFILALAMLISGIFSIYIDLSELSEPKVEEHMIASVLMVIIAFYIFLDKKRNPLRALGLYIISIGVTRVIVSLGSLNSIASDEQFYIGLVFFILGARLAAAGYSFYKGTSKNTLNMSIASYLVLLSYILVLAAYLHGNYTIESLIQNNYQTFVFIFQYMVYIMVLTSDEIQKNTVVEKIHSSISGIEHTVCVDPEARVNREDLLRINSGLSKPSEWTAVNDGGPAEYETTITLSGFVNNHILFQKWKDREFVYATIIPNSTGTFMPGRSMKVDSIIPENGSLEDCESFYFKGPDGIVAKLGIIPAIEEGKE